MNRLEKCNELKRLKVHLHCCACRCGINALKIFSMTAINDFECLLEWSRAFVLNFFILS